MNIQINSVHENHVYNSFVLFVFIFGFAPFSRDSTLASAGSFHFMKYYLFQN